jgi:hypothetical protein
MALASNPYGFQPSRHRNGGEIRLSSGYAIASGYASNIFAGDLVKSTGSSILGVPTIQLAVAGDTILGVFGGFANPITLTTGALQMPKFWAASTATLSGTVNQAMVYDDPDIIFNAMVSTTGTGTPDLSGAWNLNVGAGGNAVTGISGEFADTTGSTVFRRPPISIRPAVMTSAVSACSCRWNWFARSTKWPASLPPPSSNKETTLWPVW